jgi:hypothetical protein
MWRHRWRLAAAAAPWVISLRLGVAVMLQPSGLAMLVMFSVMAVWLLRSQWECELCGMPTLQRLRWNDRCIACDLKSFDAWRENRRRVD